MKPSVLGRDRPCSNSPRCILTLVAVVYALFILIRLWVHAWDVSYFVTAGDVFTDRQHTPAGLHVMQGAMGHDGQFYYRLALDPFTNRATDYGITLDLPGYRQQRILYPLLTYCLSFGHARWVPFWMLAINFAGICAIGWGGGKYVQSLGLHAVWGLAFACYPGFVLSLARDFTEILAAALLIGTLWLIRADRLRAATLLATLAGFARETTLLVSVSVLVVALWKSWKTRRFHTGLLFFFPLLAGIVWQVYLWINWGHLAASDTGTLSPPFVSFISSLIEKTAFETGQHIAGFFQMLLVAGFAIAAGLAFRTSTAAPHEKIAWILYVGLACAVSGNVWSEDWSFLRNLWELYLFGAVVLMTSPSRAKQPFFACWGVLWLFEYVLRMDIHKFG